MDQPDIANTPAVRGRMFPDRVVPPDQAGPAETHQAGNPSLPASAVKAHTPMDEINRPKPRRKNEPKRNRAWEQANRGVTFRHVPQEIRQSIRDVAEGTGYTTSQVAQAFLEYTLDGYKNGAFVLEPELTERGASLYPGGRWRAEARPVWAAGNGQRPAHTPARGKRGKQAAEGVSVTYRLSRSVAQAIEQICGQQKKPGRKTIYYIPTGEVLTRFLSFALDAYAAGRMILTES